jgi:hypothetical protein
MLSQLGLIILGGSGSSADEMSARPDPDGSYGPLDGLLEEAAAQVAAYGAIDGRDFGSDD